MSLSNDPERRRGDALAERVTIRPFEWRDIPAIREIDALAFDADDQYETSFYDNILNSNDLHAFVAVHNRAIVGWALLDMRGESTRLRSLSVDPEHQGQGGGRALLEYAITQCKGGIDLLVSAENTSAIALYEKFGFSHATPDPEMPERLRMVRR